MRIIIAAVLSCALYAAQAQTGDRTLYFDLRYGDHPLTLGTEERAPGGAIIVTTLRFYVGHLVAMHKGEVVWSDETYHLIDASDPGSLFIDVPESDTIDVISFMLGVDSLTNVSGAFGGDLDPTKGMYWTWNSGYINLKLEGSCAARSTRKGEFQFHLGGYLPRPHAQEITLLVRKAGAIEVHVDLARFFERVDVALEANVMSPGERALFLSEVAAQMFSCDEGRP